MSFDAILESAVMDGFDASTIASIFLSLSEPAVDRVYCVEMYPTKVAPNTVDGAAFYQSLNRSLQYSKNSYSIESTLDGPILDLPVNLNNVVSKQFPFFYSDRGYNSYPTDTLSNRYFEGRLSIPLSIERHLPLTPEDGTLMGLTYGQVELINNDGALDTVSVDYQFESRDIVVKIGKRSDSYNNFYKIFDGVMTGISANYNRASVSVRDKNYNLEFTLQSQFYSGSGGYEGTSNLAGKPRPLCFGRVSNITPVLVDPANLIYQIHNGVIDKVVSVYDQGAALTDSGLTTANYSDLVSLSVPASNFAECRSLGLFKLGSPPNGLITADARGDATGGYVNTHGDVAYRILTIYAGLSPSIINSGTFIGFSISYPGEMGFFINENLRLTSEVIQELLLGSGGFCYCDRDGKICVGSILDPSVSSPSYYFTQSDIIDVEVLQLPVSVSPPNWRRTVGWRKNWTVQDGQDLAGSVTTTRRQFLAQEYRESSASDTSVLSRNTSATNPQLVPSNYHNEVDAYNSAVNLINLHSKNRLYLDITLKSVGHIIDLLYSVNIVYNRYGLSGGRLMRVVGISEDAERRLVRLRLWG